MKTPVRHLVVLLTLIIGIYQSPAQGTAFTYQGRLNNGGSPASGVYDLTFTLYNVNSNGLPWAGPITNGAVAVNGGMFNATIDFGAGVFTGGNYWLEIGVRTNGGGAFSTLVPRQPVMPTPYAIMANSASNLLGTLPASQVTGPIPANQLSGTIPSANLSGTYSGPVTFNNGADVFDGTFIGQFIGSSFLGGTFTGQFLGDGSGLVNLNASQLASGTVPYSRLPGNIAFLNSNQTFTAQNIFMGNIGIGNPNPIPYYLIDMLAPQAVSRFVSTNAGNGSVLEFWNISPYPNEYIGAINFNNASNSYAGQIGYIAQTPTNIFNDYFEFRVGGSIGLQIHGDPRGAGAANLIGGYSGNSISTDGTGGASIMGGGYPGGPNTISSNSPGSFIGAGSDNRVGPNTSDSIIVGGVHHVIAATNYTDVIGGGYQNAIRSYSGESTIAGGVFNTIYGNLYYFTNGVTIANTIGGGSGNSIFSDSIFTTLAGGANNTIHGSSFGSTIAGGYFNVIQTNNMFVTIGGGYQNVIQTNATDSTIGGGYNNTIFSSAGSAVIGGGLGNSVLVSAYQSTIAGGIQNVISNNAYQSTIGGGGNNQVLPSASTATIGGGADNRAGGPGATVPGGSGNGAMGVNSFAAGTQAQATNDGAFVLADLQYTNFYSTTSNQFSARFRGGVRFETAGAGMTIDGQPVLSTSGDGSGLTGVNASTLNGFSSSAFAPASGSANYIQNQNAGPQTASFNINGTATVAGNVSARAQVTANSLIVTNSAVAANAGVTATNSVANLTLTNMLRVAGAGINTATAAFTQFAVATNTSSDLTIIFNPLCDNDPNAILVVTHNYNPGNSLGFVVYNHTVGVFYNGSHWTIYNEDLSNMPTNVAFNVLVIKR